ncbi:hypothetical protein JTE90_000842 [Oedothorax gibbosus]|uniref:Uncharacterized protein n=1 Tax=Oedothorax gibbosus TaxID=931172 RepID=A0AAV6VVI3_9ARAC|nr:hypothetical protein JTE90_000842 [Oedothorax gibbosus]
MGDVTRDESDSELRFCSRDSAMRGRGLASQDVDGIGHHSVQEGNGKDDKFRPSSLPLEEMFSRLHGWGATPWI